MDTILDEISNLSPNNKPRNAWVAFGLSILTPSLGQFYNGQIKKGIILYVSLFLLPIVCGFIGLMYSFWGFVFVLLAIYLFHLYIIVDAIIMARRQNKDYILKSINQWYIYIAIAVIILGINTLVEPRTFLGIHHFQIPTPTNEPTIQPNDRILANMRAYSYVNPSYGDMIIFNKNGKGEFWVYRVVGLPNDKLDIVNNVVHINGKTDNSTLIRELEFQERQFTIPMQELEEEFPNGRKHRIYRPFNTGNEKISTIYNIQVPDNHYYLLGDNREFAQDSRFIGAVPKEQIVGKMLFCFWNSEDFSRIGFDYTQH